MPQTQSVLAAHYFRALLVTTLALCNPLFAQDLPPPADLAAMARIILAGDQKLTVSLSPSIRLKTFSPSISVLIEKKVPPLFSPGESTNKTCDMQHFQMKLTSSDGTKVKEFAILSDPQPGGAAPLPLQVLARTNGIAVDSDGSSRSYHPNDPLGTGTCKLVPGPSGGFIADNVCAIDTFHDAEIHVFKETTRLGGADLVTKWKTFWPAILDKTAKQMPPDQIAPVLPKDQYYGYYFQPEKLTAFFKSDIIPSTNAGLPCVRQSASRFHGYFVAATARKQKTNVAGSDIGDSDSIAPPECKPQRWLDASTVPFFVIPGGPFGQIAVGDIAILYANVRGQDRAVYAIIGDSGPADGFGEASAAALQLLRNGALSGIENNEQLNQLDRGDINISVLLLGGTRDKLGDVYTLESIKAVATAELAVWNRKLKNPLDRIKACHLEAPLNKR